MARFGLREFIETSTQKDRGQGLFELERDRVLEVNLNGDIWTKTGSMIAYVGNVKFEREGILQQGMGNLLKKMVSGEGTQLTKASGRGVVFLADSGKKITILKLEGIDLRQCERCSRLRNELAVRHQDASQGSRNAERRLVQC